MRNMSKKTWKLRVRSYMTEMQKLDILLKHAKVPHTYGRRWPEMDRPDYQDVKENLETPSSELHDRDAEAGYSAEAR